MRLFVPQNKSPEDPETRLAVGRLSGITGIVCNAVLFGFKLAVGILSGSVAITADAVNNLSDAVSSVVTLLGFKLAERPADSEHPYGHARYEYLTGLAVAMLILVIGVELGKSSVEKILHPTAVAMSVPMIAVLAGAILLKGWMGIFNTRLGRHIDSTALLATAADSRNDVISTAAVLAAAVVEYFTHWRVDGYMGAAVAVFILYSGISLAKDTISPLLGEGASEQLREQIVQVVTESPMVLGYHDMMVHDYGPGQRFASIHVEMDQKEDPLLCHEIIDDLERRCFEKHKVHLVIHYDPIVVGDTELEEMRLQTEKILKTIDTRLTLHDFRMVKGTGHSNLIFDVPLPADMKGREREIKQTTENALAESNQGIFNTVITFDALFFNQ